MRQRPLSPHISIYRPQLTSFLSILHRLTGIGLSVALFSFLFFIYAVAESPALFQTFVAFVHNPLGHIIFLSLAFCLFYHAANGIRHLLWDMGYGFAIGTVYKTGYTVVVVSIAATALLFWCMG